MPPAFVVSPCSASHRVDGRVRRRPAHVGQDVRVDLLRYVDAHVPELLADRGDVRPRRKHPGSEVAPQVVRVEVRDVRHPAGHPDHVRIASWTRWTPPPWSPPGREGSASRRKPGAPSWPFPLCSGCGDCRCMRLSPPPPSVSPAPSGPRCPGGWQSPPPAAPT